MPPEIHKLKKGTTLVELLMALAVISIGLLALYSAIIFGMTIHLKIKHRNLAYNMGGKEMEIIRNTAFTSLSLQNEGPFIGSFPEMSQLPHGEGLLTISPYQGNGDIKQIEIKVRWQEFGEQKDIKLSTLVYKEGLNQ